MKVTIVHFEVPDLHRRELHDVVQDREINRRFVDLDEAVLDPGFVMVTRREVARELDADALGKLRMQVGVGDGVVEAVAHAL